ncbi:NADPH:quinone oxidoreductase [plant metagenome]|uniref:NADPH:quinone oxidoreductase n=1 Tax=plant metagenome TaxID=1297885 RepID=A0A484QNL2_9ZZZZ
MSNYSIAVLVGSLRADSSNKKLARAIERLAPKDVSFQYADIGALPLYNQDDEQPLPEPVADFKALVNAAHGVLFVTPEYNRSIPGVLKNAIDWGSRPYGKSSWAGRPSAVIGTSPGATGTAMAQQHLRNILAGQGSPTLTTPEAFLQFKEDLIDDQHAFTNAGTRDFVQGWLNRYLEWVRKLSA